MRRGFVDPAAPQRDAIDEAAKWIRLGCVAAIPTDTRYGLGADPFSAAAVARVFAIKGRAAARALPLVAADVEQIVLSLGPLPDMARRLGEHFWPGPLTILMPAVASLAREVSGGTGRGGGRVPAGPVARAGCVAGGHPLAAPRANRTGGARPATADKG